MKTFEELIASGSAVEVAAAIKTNTDRVNALFGEATKRADKANTQDELDEIIKLDEETEKLQAKHAELKKVQDAMIRNQARIKALATPANAVPFANTDGGAQKAYTVPTSIGTLKHIKVGTRQENEETAYRFAQFFFATSLKPGNALQMKAMQFCADHGIELKANAENTNSDGGALVPPEFEPMLIRLLETYGIFRQYTRMSAMASDTKTQPRRTGGVTAYWVTDGASITASSPTYDNVQLVAKKLACLTKISSELNEDAAISIADQLAFEVAYAFSLLEDQSGFIGDGTSTYGGITGITQKLLGLSGTIANIAGLFVGTGNNYSELVLTDFQNTAALLPQYADSPNAAWFAHRGFYYGVMQKLELAAGGVTAREIATGDRSPRPLFLGYPVVFTQVMPHVEANSQVCTVLGDLSLGTTMGDRRTRTLFTDPYSLAANDQIQIRATERIDINIHDVGNASSSAGSRVPGPIVGLIMAAS